MTNITAAKQQQKQVGCIKGLQGFGLLCKIECSGEVRATENWQRIQTCSVSVVLLPCLSVHLGELMGRLCLQKPSGSARLQR